MSLRIYKSLYTYYLVLIPLKTSETNGEGAVDQEWWGGAEQEGALEDTT